ncbi:hypothetical protein AGMMS49938_10740 [Fibrobacterales bacterium]|nr:hypothetical protein AGMMS49938_10740 [Fibrobacterales bacterium]
MVLKKIIFVLICACSIYAAPLFMLPLESDADSNLTVLWENSVLQLFKEADFEPKKIDPANFSDCTDIECVISKSRALGAQGLFRGRIKTEDDSISVRFHIDWLAGNSTPQSEVQGKFPITWNEVLNSGNLQKIVSNITGKFLGNSNSALVNNSKETIISVETNPENAVVMLNGTAICKSPCNFSSPATDTAEISAYHDTNDNLWAEKTVLKIGSQDTAKIYLSLKRSFANTEIRSNPSNAKIFNAGIIDVRSKSIGKTPFILTGEPGENQIRIFSEGYRDTLLNVKIDALEKQVIFVQLTPITDPQELANQNSVIKSMKKRNIGLGLIGGSVGTLIAGTALCIFARDDYTKARDLKDELSYPSLNGDNFNSKVDENHKAIRRGNAKTAFGGGLIGFSLLLAGVGFAMSF